MLKNILKFTIAGAVALGLAACDSKETKKVEETKVEAKKTTIKKAAIKETTCPKKVQKKAPLKKKSASARSKR